MIEVELNQGKYELEQKVVCAFLPFLSQWEQTYTEAEAMSLQTNHLVTTRTQAIARLMIIPKIAVGT